MELQTGLESPQVKDDTKISILILEALIVQLGVSQFPDLPSEVRSTRENHLHPKIHHLSAAFHNTSFTISPQIFTICLPLFTISISQSDPRVSQSAFKVAQS
jgi:hypothetical protein